MANKWILACGLALTTFVPFVGAKATDFNVLYAFQGALNGPDGAEPGGGLIADKMGILYGTTFFGGASGNGTVFEIQPGVGETILYSFEAGSDGTGPDGSLIEDGSGNFLGTTSYGGGSSCACGTVFKVAQDGSETVLYAFKGGSDGALPTGGLLAGTQGKLFGTTELGGNFTGDCGQSGCGTVFRLDPNGKKTVLYSFEGGNDSATPDGPLISDSSGNLYGTTFGQDEACGNCGTVFRLAPDGTETILYSFCGLAYCTDGSNPSGGLIRDSAGNLYGETWGGGANGGGTVFKLAPDGTESVLYSLPVFSEATGKLVADQQGNLYGATWSGGDLNGKECQYKRLPLGCGSVFEVTPSGAETVLHSFNQSLGKNPTGSLVLLHGYLYGTTEGGGSSSNCGTNHKNVPYGCGTVFAVKR